VVNGRVYLDSSAIVRWIAQEPGWDFLDAFLRRHPDQLSSRIAFVEVGRAQMRNGGFDPDSRARTDSVLGRLSVVELTPRVAAIAASVGAPTLRSMDAIHLASCIVLVPEVDAFVTYDRRLGEAAAALGLVLASP
jgi:predicted nucleic acid-binding protein